MRIETIAFYKLKKNEIAYVFEFEKKGVVT